MNNSLKVVLAYTGTDFKRAYNFTDVTQEAITSAKNKILAINASLQAGTSDGMDTFFLSDDYDGTNGKLEKIEKATAYMVEEVDLT